MLDHENIYKKNKIVKEKIIINNGDDNIMIILQILDSPLKNINLS
jgi:hypothetical protein